MPGAHALRPTIVPGLIDVKFGSPFEVSSETVKYNIATVVDNLVANGLAPGGNSNFEWAAFGAHALFELTVGVDAIRKGFYRDLYALQGERATWWMGASWHTQDSAMLWEFTEGIVESMLAAL